MVSRLVYSSLKRSLNFSRYLRTQTGVFKSAPENVVDKGPIKFTTSKAAEWKAVYSNAGENYHKTPRIQSSVVMMSLTILMIYFCVLREENDLDEWLKGLEHEVPLQKEEIDLQKKIEDAQRTNCSTKEYELKLERILEIRRKISTLSH